jgi:SAM-dependent methyltransferase
MSSQSEIFLEDEGDKWFERNKDKPVNSDVASALCQLASFGYKPGHIVEVGCGYGRYLSMMQDAYGCRCTGIEPSKKAVEYGREKYPEIDFVCDGANYLSMISCDILVFGFCLYLADRDHLTDIVCMADQALKDDGYLIIHDFDPPHPQVVPYHHRKGVWSYKMDYPKLWAANPAYEYMYRAPIAEGEAVTILKKGTWDKWLAI